jgi:tetratricopeptide (TPR) repeat protein
MAIADFTEAIRLDPRYGKAYENRGWTWYCLGNDALGLADYEEAARLSSESANPPSNSAISSDRADERKTGIDDFFKAHPLESSGVRPSQTDGVTQPVPPSDSDFPSIKTDRQKKAVDDYFKNHSLESPVTSAPKNR